MGVEVMADRAAAFRRIWPPPSSMLPAGHGRAAMDNVVSAIDFGSTDDVTGLIPSVLRSLWK